MGQTLHVFKSRTVGEEDRSSQRRVVRFLFHDDSAVYGGHEVMALLGVKALLDRGGAKVLFQVSRTNRVLLDELRAIPNADLKIDELEFHSSKFQGILNPWLCPRVQALAARMRAWKPDLVVCVQGNIEHSSIALLAARRACLQCASYIPLPHTNAEMGAKLGSIRDWFTTGLFQVPDSFITISEEMAAILRQRGARCPVKVVYNGIDTKRFQPRDRESARQALGWNEGGLFVGMVGRIEFRQKQQHILVEAVARSALADKLHLVFAGDGPDRERLGTLLKRRGLEGRAKLPGWIDPATLYPALDALVVASRYEGVPLVMLEALACAIPVVGTDRDGMKDILPPSWRFRPNDPAAIDECLGRLLRSGGSAELKGTVERVRNEMNLTVFRESFSTTLISLAKSSTNTVRARSDPD